jgi:HK97 family phage portal protein
LTDSWNALLGKPQANALDRFVMQFLGNLAIYPSPDNTFYLNSYTGNNDVFTVINKITEPASTVPIYQYDKDDNIVEGGKMLALLNKPNPYQSRSLFIESGLSFYYIFGEGFTAFDTLDKSSGSLNAGVPMRLDALPSQWMMIKLGTFFDPVKGYSFYPFGSSDVVDYDKSRIFHWKEFNPDYSTTGGHLRGMSRLKPLIKSITGSEEGYNSLVKAFQAQGMWGIVTMLEPETKKAVELTKEQKSILKSGWQRDMKKGELTISNSIANYTKMGLSVVELEILRALGMLSGKITDAFNVPDQLFAGSQTKTYSNYKEAERALWANAICPSLDAYLEGLSNLLAPNFPGEEETVLKADYSGIEALQHNMVELVGWMVQAQAFSRNEIREATGYEMIEGNPMMDEIMVSAGLTPISELGQPPDSNLVDNVMKELHLSDYRKKVNGN